VSCETVDEVPFFLSGGRKHEPQALMEGHLETVGAAVNV
jgi:hypothetical protein